MNLVQVPPKGRFGEMISFEFHLKNRHEKTQKPLWFLGFQPRYLFRCYLLVAGVGLEPHDLRVMSPTSYQLLYPAIFCSVVPVTGLEPVQYRYRGILSPLCLPIPPHRQLSAMIRIPYSPVIVKHGQGKPFKFFRQLPLQKVQTGARFRAIFRPEAHILAENPNAKEEIK